MRCAAGWLTLGLTLACAPAPEPPAVATARAGPARALPPDLLGANANLAAFDRPWDNDTLAGAAAELGLRTVRYPAGTLGNYWDWDRGWLDREVPDSMMIPWVVAEGYKHASRRYTLDNLAEGYRRTGATPVFMLNMLSRDLAHARRNLRRAAELGLPVRYVELGNELYFDLPFPTSRYPAPEDYGRACQVWIDTLRRDFPAAKFAVVGSDMTRHARQVNWTARVLSTCRNADAVTAHRYTSSGLDGQRERKSHTAGVEGLGDAATATREAPAAVADRQRWEARLLSEPAAWANVLTTARAAANGWRGFGIPDSLEAWVTEFNLRADSSAVLHTWAHGLFLSVYFGAFLEADQVTLANVHNLVGSRFGLLHVGEGNLAHRLDSPAASTPFAPTGGGVALALFNRAIGDATEMWPLRFAGARELTDDRGVSFPTLAGWLFGAAGDPRSGLLVNYGLRAASVALPGGVREATAYTAPVAQPVNGWPDVTEESILPDRDRRTLHLPARSITLVRLPTQ